MPSAKIKLFGFPLTDWPAERLLLECTAWIASGQSHRIVTLNAEKVMRSQRDTQFAQTLLAADLLIVDGVALQWAAGVSGPLQGLLRGLGGFLAPSLLHRPIAHRVTGVDFSDQLMAAAAEHHWPVALIGGLDTTAERAALIWRDRHPGLHIVLAEEGLRAKDSAADEVALVKRVAAAKPKLLLIAMPDPMQEQFLANHLSELNVPVMMAVGGTFDFVTGQQKRAPSWMRASGLEWLWRLIREPRRIGRQSVLPQFVWKVLHNSHTS